MSGGSVGEFRRSFRPPFTCYHQPTQSTYLTLVTNHHQQGHPGKGNVNASPPHFRGREPANQSTTCKRMSSPPPARRQNQYECPRNYLFRLNCDSGGRETLQRLIFIDPICKFKLLSECRCVRWRSVSSNLTSLIFIIPFTFCPTWLANCDAADEDDGPWELAGAVSVLPSVRPSFPFTQPRWRRKKKKWKRETIIFK